MAALNPGAALVFALPLAVLLSLALSPVLLGRYHRTLTRLMGAGPAPQAPIGEAPASGTEAWTIAETPIHPTPQVFQLPTASVMGRRERRLWWSLAGLSALVGMTAAFLYLGVFGAGVGGINPLRVLVVGLWWAAPGWVLQLLLMRWAWPRVLLAAAALVVGLLGVLVLASNPLGSNQVLSDFKLLVFIVYIPLLVLGLLFGIPRWRAVAPFLFLPVLLICLLAEVGLGVLADLFQNQPLLIKSWLHWLGAPGTMILLPLLFALAGIGLAHRLTILSGKAYRARAFSDLTWLYGATWLLVLLLQSLPGWNQSGFAWSPLLPLCAWLWIPLFFAWLAPYWLATSASQAPGPVLLVLRVFRRPGPMGQLFDQVVQRWRFLGPVVLISASDLAGRTLEPDALVSFLEGRTRGRYIANPDDLRRQLEALPLGPDHDGRYRISEFCCYDTSWKQVLEALLLRSHAVLMDLRGFQAANRGCLYELARVAQARHLAAVLLLADAQTDRLTAESALTGCHGPLVWIEPNPGQAGLVAKGVLESLLKCDQSHGEIPP